MGCRDGVLGAAHGRRELQGHTPTFLRVPTERIPSLGLAWAAPGEADAPWGLTSTPLCSPPHTLLMPFMLSIGALTCPCGLSCQHLSFTGGSLRPGPTWALGCSQTNTFKGSPPHSWRG